MTNQTETFIEAEQIIDAPRQPVTKRDLIEQNVDKVINPQKAASVEVSADLGGTGFRNMLEVIESAKMMAMSGPMIPQWLRGNPGGCWAIILQAIEWKFSPLSVAKMSFEVNGNVAYMSQLVHAVIEARAPIQGRMRCEYEGEGGDRICIVSATFKGDDEPQIYRSPMLKNINPKNSPLWKNDPDQQLWYFASRAWCRRFAPDVLLGVYAKDELMDSPLGEEGEIESGNVSPGLHSRLKGVDRTEGHQPGFAEKELAHVAGGSKQIQPAQIPPHKKRSERRKERMAKQTTAADASKDAPEKANTETAEPADKPAETENPQPGTEPQKITDPKTADEYENYATRWIENTADPDDIAARWDGEHEMRDALVVRIPVRKRLQDKLQERCQKLRDQQ